jgi:hypothetical protein
MLELICFTLVEGRGLKGRAPRLRNAPRLAGFSAFISLLSPDEADELLRLTSASWSTIQVQYHEGSYKINEQCLSYIDVVEKLEDLGRLSQRTLILLRTDKDNVLAQSPVIETFQRVNSAVSTVPDRRLHLAIVVS